MGKTISNEENKSGFNEIIKDFFAILLCIIAGIAFIAGTIALLVLVVFPLASNLTVKQAWFGTIYLSLMIFFISREVKKNPRHKPFKHFLLWFFFPLWLIVWMCNTTEYLNVLPNVKQRKPVAVFFLWLFVPFYSVYWMYQSAKRIDILAIRKGVNSNISTVCLILSLILGLIIPSILIQQKINKIEE